MSGLEVPGLVFGVLPVFVQVLQSYRNILNTLNTFRHYSREVKRIKDRFKIQQHNFQNEYSLLQYSIAGEDDSQATLTVKNYSTRINAPLEEHLNKRLDDSYEACEVIISDTKRELDEMEEDLKSFSVLKNEKRQHEKLKATIYRVRNSITVAFDKERYERRLSKLRENNMDLHIFRVQLEELLKKRSDTFKPPKLHKRLPRHYSSVQEVSQTLHEALFSAWNCPHLGHETHYGKLCVEAQVQDMVRLDLALSYKLCQSDDSSNSSKEEEDNNHVWIYVQSAKMGTKSEGSMQRNSLDIFSSSDGLAAALYSNQTDAHLSLALHSETQARSSKRRKVQLADDCIFSQSPAYAATEVSDLRDITKMRDLCQHIEKIAHSSGPSEAGECIGYLETPQLFKHMFYSNEQETFRSPIGKGRCLTQDVVNLEYLLQTTNRDPASVDTGSKLKIAHKIATAVLQYHSTPWLREDWRLKDLAYFGKPQGLSDESLRTLHLTFCFNQSYQDLGSTCARWGSQMSTDSTCSSMESMYYQHGISNTVLFSLGVALLELAYHQPLERMSGAQDPIAAARKKAMSGHPLGRKYQKIVQQCLRCDFGMGSDLTKTELQTSIYGDVICSLEEMINSLTLD